MLDQDTFRSVLGHFASGVTVVTTVDAAGTDHGMTVSAFCSASLEPPLVLACIDHQASMHGVLEETGWFSVNILSAGQERLSRRFADLGPNRFEGIGFSRGAQGAAKLENITAFLECRVSAICPAGDHTIFLGEVESAEVFDPGPLIYYRSGYTGLER